jgi:hypothetical protein
VIEKHKRLFCPLDTDSFDEIICISQTRGISDNDWETADVERQLHNVPRCTWDWRYDGCLALC